jgi:hypothetical protein
MRVSSKVVPWRPSRPPQRVSRLLDPFPQFRTLRLLQTGQFDVSSPVGRSERGRGLEVGPAEEEDIDGNVVGGYFDDPPEF